MCACVQSSGATVYFPTSSIDDAYTLFTDEDGNENQYPWNYGVGQCAAHDEGLTGFGCDDDENAPGYCAQQWCYVSEECTAEDVASSGVVDGAFFSYNACGGDGEALSASEQAAVDAEAAAAAEAEAAAAGEGEGEEATEEGEDESGEGEGEGDAAGEDDCGSHESGCGSNNVSIKIEFGVNA